MKNIHIEKATQIPYSPSALNPSNLSQSLKISVTFLKKKKKMGRKVIFIQLNNYWKGSGAVDYIIMQKPNDVLILEIMWRFCRRMHPLWIKHIEWFRWCGKCEHFFPLLGVFCTFYPERKLCFKTNKSIP